MKKILCAILAIMMIATAVVLTSCNQTEATPETLKLGLGVYSYYEGATDASADGNGKGEVITTAAAVLVDKDGKIVKCEIDTIDNVVEYTAEGKFVTTEFKTKYELGADYGMKNPYYGSAKEWFEHADAFESVVVGKTVADVKALVAADGKGTDALINAGCTISASDFVSAVEKAVANAKDSEATADSTLGLGIASSMSGEDATADKAGKIEIDTSIVAMALDADGKVIASSTDCAASEFGFDAAGAATTNTTKALSTKGELGAAYGMKNPNYGSAKEWFEHAAAFDATCAGKNATEIAALANYGVAGDALVSAGCTVYVGNIVKAAVKAATIG